MSYARIETLNCNEQGEHHTNCQVEAALSIVGGKWKLKIISLIYFREASRFSQLKRKIKGITEKSLTLQLKELEADQLITRKAYPTVPPKVEYSLTPLGEKTMTIYQALHEWGQAYIQEVKGIEV